jgi:Putative zinc-finger
MRCDDALVAVSARADDELPPSELLELDAHLATCERCRSFMDDVARLRSSLRLEPVDRAPDVGPTVLARLRADLATDGLTLGEPVGPAPQTRRGVAARRVAVAAAAAAVAGLVAGGTFVGIGSGGRSPAAADVPEQVLSAQAEIDAVDARYAITETGAHGDGDGRAFAAELTYRAPEALALRVSETTAGVPPGGRAAGSLVVDGDRWWHDATRQCSPAAGLVRCPPEAPRWSRSVTGREPFSDEAPVPLELVTPVDGFALSAPPAGLGRRTIAGHDAVGVEATAAQVARLLDGLSAAVELRPVHPTDPVELWLDDDHFVPLALVVRAAGGHDRAAWATSVGAADQPGDVVLRVEATELRVNDQAGDRSDVAAPSGAADEDVDAGFRPAGDDHPAVSQVPEPGSSSVPAGFAPYRQDVVATPGGPSVGVRSWSDGRAWFTVRATAEWPGRRLFGDLGPDIRPLDLGAAGSAYASGDGQRIGLHTDGLDVVVGGSLAPADLRQVAAGLGIVGSPVPGDWAEATSSDQAAAAAALPGLLTAGTLDGFGAPSFRVTAVASAPNTPSGPTEPDRPDTPDTDTPDAVTVTESRSGPGERAFTLTQWRASSLVPPSGGDEVGVDVRGVAGRYSPQRGELEWVESGLAVSLRSDALGLPELLDIARRLEPA